MDDQSLELFNLISILKKVTKKQEILEDIKNLETEIIDLNYLGNNSYKISLRICKIWKYAVHLFGNIDDSDIELGFGFKWDYIFNCFKLHCAVKINSSESFIYDYSEFFEYFFSEEEQYYKVNEISNKAWLSDCIATSALLISRNKLKALCDKLNEKAFITEKNNFKELV